MASKPRAQRSLAGRIVVVVAATAAVVAVVTIAFDRWLAIHRSSFASSAEKGSMPSSSSTWWNARTSNLSPSSFSARARISCHLMPPSGYDSTSEGRLLISATDCSARCGGRSGMPSCKYLTACSAVQPLTCMPRSTTIIGVIELICAPMKSRSES